MSDKKILVIEDDTFLAKMLVRALESTGHDITIATNGEEGLRKTEGQEYDLVLLDLYMPEMDGFELLSHMQDDEKLQLVPVVIMSADGDKEIIDNCLSMSY